MTDDPTTSIGPVQVLVVGFPHTDEFTGSILAEREALDEDEVWYAADAIPPGTTAAVAARASLGDPAARRDRGGRRRHTRRHVDPSRRPCGARRGRLRISSGDGGG